MPITTIPFFGFYNTLHSANLDDALESAFLAGSDAVTDTILLQRAQDATEWQIVFAQYASYYAAALAKEFNINMRFESLKSPKEYNFSTDIIYCEIEQSEVDWLYSTCDKVILDKLAREKLTSRSGFMSFYDPDFTTWGDTSEWEHNQIGLLIEAVISEANPDFDMWSELYLMEDAGRNGALENWIFESNPKEVNRLFSIKEYLQNRKGC